MKWWGWIFAALYVGAAIVVGVLWYVWFAKLGG